MKKSVGFWESLEKYSWGVIGRSPLPRYWAWVGIGLVVAIILASAANVKNSVAGARDLGEVISMAAERGDYTTARRLFEQRTENMEYRVLGAEVELEDKAYPERMVERRIAELENKLEEYPENKDVYLMLADLYGQLGNAEAASEYREKARILDPNGAEFQ